MELQEQHQHQDNLSSITHSPYYGCTVRVVSKALVSYEGVLDGISTTKDRIFLKNVRVKGNVIGPFDRDNSLEEFDTFNSVMIDHLTNDMHIYEEVCLNVRDIQELRLIRLPLTFHESRAKLRAIDPCLVDIRLSPSDEHERMSNVSTNEHHQPAPIARRSRGESIGSNGGALITSSSNESSSSFGYRSGEKFTTENNDEQIEKFDRLTTNATSKPVTLLAKKVLPKKIARRMDINSTNNSRLLFSENRQTNFGSIQGNNGSKKPPVDNYRRKASPIRVTITSKLNPDATPFYTQQRPIPAAQNPLFTFYEQNRFRPRDQPVVSSHHSQSVIHETNTTYNNGRQQQNHQQHSHQRFIPPRQMAIKKNFNTQIRPSQTPPTANYPSYSSLFSDKQSYPQQQTKREISNHEQLLGLIHRTSSSTMDQILSRPPIRECISVPNNTHPRRSPVTLHSTASLPYQQGKSGDRNQFQSPLSFGEPFGSHRGQRTISGTSSGSSLSIDIGPHSIVQLDSTSNSLTSANGQYDFEKANEEFRRYLELEEMVTRRAPSVCSTQSHPDDNSSQQSQGHSYKKEVSFFDRISCTATTGTAVAYAEMDEVEKNRQTFGDDAFLISSDSNNNEWQI